MKKLSIICHIIEVTNARSICDEFYRELKASMYILLQEHANGTLETYELSFVDAQIIEDL